MGATLDFLTRTHGHKKLDLVDISTYLYLILGVLIMFVPVVWLVLSSFKTSAEIVHFPPRLLPYRQDMVQVIGYEKPLPLYNVTLADGTVVRLAEVARIGLESQLVDPANPTQIIKVNIKDRVPVEHVDFSLDNFVQGINSFNFGVYLRNSVIVTVVATLLTLLFNSMAAFAFSKYKFRGSNAIFLTMIATLMVPISTILVPIFLVITTLHWNNTLIGIIIPTVATPTGVFLLRQYMLTLPDELIDAARIDGASEWRIYAQIILPLSKPALAVLAIFSVMWRWNDFLWPLVVLSKSEFFTLQVGLASFQGELNVQWNLILAMTVLTLLPITLIFSVLQENITTGIATTGMK
jgi:alpha-1,4-digalacturonate transport system permease protein